MSHLKVAVLVDGAAGVRGHVCHGGQVGVLAGEEEEIDAAALRHALLGQLLVHAFLRLEQSLTRNNKRVKYLPLKTIQTLFGSKFFQLLTFSLSVFTSFLSSLFFSLPGASAVGMEE